MREEDQDDATPRCFSCGNPLEHPADVEEGYHFLCVVPALTTPKCAECGGEIEVEASNDFYCYACLGDDPNGVDEGGESGC